MNRKVSMVEYYNLRFGYCDNDSESDFIDNINGKLNIQIAKGFDEQEHQYLFVFHNDKFLSKSESSLLDHIDMIVRSFSKLDSRFSDIAKGLILSLYDREDYGINTFSPKYNKGCFEANETDEVCDYSPCFFGVGSVTYDLNLPNSNVSPSPLNLNNFPKVESNNVKEYPSSNLISSSLESVNIFF